MAQKNGTPTMNVEAGRERRSPALPGYMDRIPEVVGHAADDPHTGTPVSCRFIRAGNESFDPKRRGPA